MNSEDQMKDKLLKTGTTTVGLVCKEGVVLAADMRASFGGQIVSHRKEEKIQMINENLAVTTAGLVSDIQLLVRITKAQLKLEEFHRNGKLTVKEAVHLLANLVYNNIRKPSMIAGVTGFLLGGTDNKDCYLYEIGMDGSVTQHEDFTADGSGMMFALGVLESQYEPNLSLDDTVKLAMKAVSAAMQRDTATGDGINVVTITKSGVKKVVSKTLTQKLVI